MKQIVANQSVKIPEGITVSAKSRVVTVKGPRGTLKRSFKHLALDIRMLNPRTLRVEKWFGTKKELAAVRTVCSHVENMLKGVTKGYQYKMREKMERIRQTFSLETLLCFHLTLSFLGAIGGIQWNIALFFFGLIAYNEENHRALKLFIGFLLFSMIMDITWMGIHSPYTYSGYTVKFCLSMNIISLVFKVPTLIMTLITLRRRDGTAAAEAGYTTPGFNVNPYPQYPSSQTEPPIPKSEYLSDPQNVSGGYQY